MAEKYLFNGVLLPALPENVNPYAFIAQSRLGDTFLGATLYFSKAALTCGRLDSGGLGIAIPDGSIMYECDATAEQWTYVGESSGSSLLIGALWANHDIYYADDVVDVGGTLYLAASTPIPLGTAFPSDFDPRSFAYGVRVGQAVRRLRGKAKEATHYSYNGTVLPRLPDSISKYPYAVIYRSASGIYSLATSNAIPTWNSLLYMNGQGITYRCADNEWVEYTNHEDSEGGYTQSGFFASAIIWANVDVVNSSTGSVVKSASDPVPV